MARSDERAFASSREAMLISLNGHRPAGRAIHDTNRATNAPDILSWIARIEEAGQLVDQSSERIDELEEQVQDLLRLNSEAGAQLKGEITRSEELERDLLAEVERSKEAEARARDLEQALSAATGQLIMLRTAFETTFPASKGSKVSARKLA
jgi:chromosome segregation ATPase